MTELMARELGYNNELLRLKNRGKVFEELVKNDGIYRMELAENCGLTKMAISNIVGEFLEKDIIVEVGKNKESKVGRKSTLLQLSPNAKKIVGLLIHRNFVSATLCDCRLNVIKANTIRFENSNLEDLLDKIYALVDEMISGNDILGIGVGSIGPVDVEKGVILNPPEFYGIKDVPIVKILKEKYEVPVYLDYHYNSAARAEKYFGCGKYYKNFLFLGITGGLGIASVMDAKIMTRMTGINSEIGHMLVEYNGRECFCGRRGCLGRYIDFTTEESTWESVKILCGALMGICDILLPQALIIREEEGCIKREHLDWMQKEINEKIIARDYHGIRVRSSYRSSEFEAAGCAANILGRIFSGEIEI